MDCRVICWWISIDSISCSKEFERTFNGFPWISIDFNGCQWISLDSPWISNGFQWISLNVQQMFYGILIDAQWISIWIQRISTDCNVFHWIDSIILMDRQLFDGEFHYIWFVFQRNFNGCSMNFYGFRSISIDANGFHWISQWIYNGFPMEFQWISIDVDEFHWMSIGIQ